MIDEIGGLANGRGGRQCGNGGLAPIIALCRQSTAVHTAVGIAHNKCNAFSKMKTQRVNKDRERAEQPKVFPELVMAAVLPDGNGGFTPCPELLTEDELIAFLRIPEISKSQDYHNVIENLKRMHDLPRIHVCGKPLYPLEEIRAWIKKKTTSGK